MTEQPEAALPLFSSRGTDSAPDYPALLGGVCEACGYVFFPMQSYGCERCGSQALVGMELAGRGTLVASAEVHMHMDRARPAPFVVGSVMLEGDAVVRAVLDVAPGIQLTPGTAMVTRLVPETRPDRGSQDLRFAPAA
jgi:uncharacterized OB-fold protein